MVKQAVAVTLFTVSPGIISDVPVLHHAVHAVIFDPSTALWKMGKDRGEAYAQSVLVVIIKILAIGQHSARTAL